MHSHRGSKGIIHQLIMDELDLTAIPGSSQKVTLSFDEGREGPLKAVLQGFSHLDEAEELLHSFLSALAELSDTCPDALAQLLAHANSGRPRTASAVSKRAIIADTVIGNPLPGNQEPVSITVNIDPSEDGQARHQLFSNLPGQVTKRLLQAMHSPLLEKVV